MLRLAQAAEDRPWEPASVEPVDPARWLAHAAATRGLLEVVALVEVFDEPRLRGVASQQSRVIALEAGTVGARKPASQAKCSASSSRPTQTTRRWRWRPMTSAMSRIGTPSSAPTAFTHGGVHGGDTRRRRGRRRPLLLGHDNRQALTRGWRCRDGRAPTARRSRGRAQLLSQAKGEPPGSRARPSSAWSCICIVTSAFARSDTTS